MYEFILIQWQLRRFSQTQVQNAVTKEFVTQEQADIILVTPQI